MGGPGAKGVSAGTGSWEGWVGLPTIEEVTMSVKSMLSGREGLGGREGQSFIPHRDLAMLLALIFLTPPALWLLCAS